MVTVGVGATAVEVGVEPDAGAVETVVGADPGGSEMVVGVTVSGAPAQPLRAATASKTTAPRGNRATRALILLSFPFRSRLK